jgi:hypothetical protein
MSTRNCLCVSNRVKGCGSQELGDTVVEGRLLLRYASHVHQSLNRSLLVISPKRNQSSRDQRHSIWKAEMPKQRSAEQGRDGTGKEQCLPLDRALDGTVPKDLLPAL